MLIQAREDSWDPGGQTFPVQVDFQFETIIVCWQQANAQKYETSECKTKNCCQQN